MVRTQDAVVSGSSGSPLGPFDISTSRFFHETVPGNCPLLPKMGRRVGRGGEGVGYGSLVYSLTSRLICALFSYTHS